MANSSAQMRDLLQPEERPGQACSSSSSSSCRREEEVQREAGSSSSSSSSCRREEAVQREAGSSSSSSSSSSCRREEAVQREAGSSSSSSSSSSCRREEAVHREAGSSSGCPLDELKHFSPGDDQRERLTFSRTHAVLVDVSVFNCGGGLLPQPGNDMWNSNFVKMPSSPSSRMLQSGLMKKTSQTRRWEVISKKLSALAKKTAASAEDVEDAIMKYNPKYKGQWSFDALCSFVKAVPDTESFFPKLLPKMAALALKLPECVKKVPLLKTGSSASITLSQAQISCLLANAFFCTFPHRNATGGSTEFSRLPTINFSSLFGHWSLRKKEKLKAVLHYFHVVTGERTQPSGLVTFERRCFKDSEMPDWKSCEEKMNKLHVTSHGTIETEGTGLLQVDFASSWVGGGVLGSGLVQEEILFVLHPELIVSRLFTEKLEDNECLIVTGSQRFSQSSGFGDSFQWAGPHQDRLHRDQWTRLKRKILVIDALHYKQQRDQYSMKHVSRELNKAYCGFKGRDPNEPDIATGRWGCGAFNGDAQLKAVIQLMAAAAAKRGVAFFTFQDEELQRGLQQTHRLLAAEGTTVGKLFTLLEDYCAVQRASGPHVDLFQFIGPTRSQL